MLKWATRYWVSTSTRPRWKRSTPSRSYIEHIPADSIATARSRGFEATTDFSRAPEADTLILCVPTPLNKYREPDLSFVLNTIDSLVPYLREGHLVSLESTTYPGTTDEELLPRIESRGLKVGENAFRCSRRNVKIRVTPTSVPAPFPKSVAV
ncbi:hypothetical protein [Paludibacterium denitrificans]|uniref:hypothetical protein n=1 Tax=Paludibacterium denitrificans TaxID=2675226 RepID=UPI0028A5D994|nr:hypothetical protein [Paludibacterium denitrificans]